MQGSCQGSNCLGKDGGSHGRTAAWQAKVQGLGCCCQGQGDRAAVARLAEVVATELLHAAIGLCMLLPARKAAGQEAVCTAAFCRWLSTAGSCCQSLLLPLVATWARCRATGSRSSLLLGAANFLQHPCTSRHVPGRFYS